MILLMLFLIPLHEKKIVLNHATFDAFPHSSSQKKKILLNHDSFDAFPHSSL
jgi:hypothetical protein